MKKIISTGLVLFILLTLSISVFAFDFPDNNTVGEISITSLKFGDSPGVMKYPTNWSVPFGNLALAYIQTPVNTPYDFTCVFDFEIVVDYKSTIYIPFRIDNNHFDPQLTFGDLSSYRNSNADLTFTPSASGTPLQVYFMQGIASGNNYSMSSVSQANYTLANDPIIFYCFEDVPAGTYSIQLHTYYILGTNSALEYFFGCYSSQSYGAVGDFENGSITFDEAISQVQDEINNIINSDLPDSEKLIALQIEFNNIERIKDLSDVKFNSTVSNFTDSADTIINNFLNGNTSVIDASSYLQFEYFDALSQAITPEQGTYLNTAYQTQSSRLHLLWQVEFQQHLDEVVTDDKLDENSEKLSALDQLYAEEKEVLAHFELAEFQSQLEFSLWTDTLPSDYSNYKAIFEYFLEDNKAFQISQFLIVPFSLVLVSVLLATTTVILRRSRNG